MNANFHQDTTAVISIYSMCLFTPLQDVSNDTCIHQKALWELQSHSFGSHLLYAPHRLVDLPNGITDSASMRCIGCLLDQLHTVASGKDMPAVLTSKL